MTGKHNRSAYQTAHEYAVELVVHHMVGKHGAIFSDERIREIFRVKQVTASKRSQDRAVKELKEEAGGLKSLGFGGEYWRIME